MPEMDLTSKLYAALVSTQGTLHLLLEDDVLPPSHRAKVTAAMAANEPIIEQGSEHKIDLLSE